MPILQGPLGFRQPATGGLVVDGGVVATVQTAQVQATVQTTQITATVLPLSIVAVGE